MHIFITRMVYKFRKHDIYILLSETIDKAAMLQISRVKVTAINMVSI